MGEVVRKGFVLLDCELSKREVKEMERSGLSSFLLAD